MEEFEQMSEDFNEHSWEDADEMYREWEEANFYEYFGW